MVKFIIIAITTILVVVYLLGKGEHIPPLPELLKGYLASSEPVILVASRLENMYSNQTEFPVGQPLYFRLHYADGRPPLKMFWRLQDRIIQRGIAFDTSDLKELDLKALQLSSIPTGSFLVEAFVSDGGDFHPVQKTITFFKEDRVQKSKSVGESNKRYAPTGAISYKQNEIMVIGKNGKR